MEIRYRDPKEAKASIDAFAFKVLRRLHGLGARSHTLEDVQQELWVAWCKACEAYRPDHGASFSTFLYTGMQRHINRYVEKNFERFHGETVALSLDSSESVSAGNDGTDDATLGESIADTVAGADVMLEQEQNFAYAMTRLSPRAQQFMTFLKDQPIELLQQLRALEAKGAYAKQRGISIATPQRLTTFMVFDLMGASRSERQKILEEVARVSAQMIKQAA